tara:strand:- start:75 stop:1076 length:1002 start_codon:yes stop_codon:yes gene_type:complete
MKYKKIPNNENAIEIDGKVVLSFDTRYKEYLKWRDENPDLEKELIVEVENEVERKRLYNNGSPHETKDKSGKLQGKRTFYYKSGNKKWEGTYKDGTLNGEVKQYEKSGDILSIENFKDGVLQGHYEYYHNGGKLRESGSIKNSTRHGEIKTYWVGGNLQRKENYICGVRDGSIEIYGVDGKSLLQKGQYKSNYRVGDWKFYYPNTNIIKRIDTYDHSTLVKVIDYDLNGIKVSEETKVGYKDWKKTAWYNGTDNKKYDRLYSDDKGSGRWIEWYTGGQQRSDGEMKSDSMNGKWTFWYHNGKKELECEFDFGNPVGNVKIYHDNGLIKEEIQL